MLYPRFAGAPGPDWRYLPAPPHLSGIRHTGGRGLALSVPRLDVRPDGTVYRDARRSPESTFTCRVKIAGYPVEELGGLIFAYLGPRPCLCAALGSVRHGRHLARYRGDGDPCNWLQCMENSLDPVHTEWLHGHYYNFVMGQRNGGMSAANGLPAGCHRITEDRL